jgi:hypothetical protein
MEHVAEVEEGGEGREERNNVGDAVVALVQALDDVGDKVRVGDRSADLGQGISHHLLEAEVIEDRPVFLLDVAELLGEVNLSSLLVVVKETVESRPDHVRGGGGVVSRGRGWHDEVDDVHGHGAVELAEEHGVEMGPHGVSRRRRGGEEILEGVGGDCDVEEGAPLGEDIGLEVEDDGDEEADALYGGGLRP